MTNLSYIENPSDLNRDYILDLYAANNWTNYTDEPDNLMKALANSTYIVICKYENGYPGLARCISDDSSICYIQDILVRPEFHRQGIGRELLQKCLERFKHVRTQILLTDNEEKQKLFYESLGFKRTSYLTKIPLNCYVKMNNIDLE